MTAINTNDMTTVVNMIKYIDESAPYPFGTSAVRFSLPQPDNTSINNPKRNTDFNLPILFLISVHTSLSLRSEEHTSELQSRGHLVCRLLLEKKKKQLLIVKIIKLLQFLCVEYFLQLQSCVQFN